mmetsp:Transcript_2282/g.6466  ORF Transcript_2282/g.6466 Transcript_2282/m.6466 type:complete len:328 (-) Transcript_2282:234-1217(-)
MEATALVVQGLARYAHALFARAQGAEVVRGERALVRKEFELDALGRLIADGEIHEAAWERPLPHGHARLVVVDAHLLEHAAVEARLLGFHGRLVLLDLIEEVAHIPVARVQLAGLAQVHLGLRELLELAARTRPAIECLDIAFVHLEHLVACVQSLLGRGELEVALSRVHKTGHFHGLRFLDLLLLIVGQVFPQLGEVIDVGVQLQANVVEVVSSGRVELKGLGEGARLEVDGPLSFELSCFCHALGGVHLVLALPLLLPREELNLKVESSVWRNLRRGPARAVGVVRGAGEHGFLTLMHGHDAHVPALDHLAHAHFELELSAAVAA